MGSTDETAASESATGSNPLEEDLTALAEALESGDAESAKSILSGIMEKMQSFQPPTDAAAFGNSAESVSSTGSSVSSSGNGEVSQTSSSTSSTASTDPADTNEDGTVSLEEYIAYYGKNAESSSSGSTRLNQLLEMVSSLKSPDTQTKSAIDTEA